MVGMVASVNSRSRLAAPWDDPGVALVVLDLASVETYFLVRPLACLAFEQEGAVWCPLISSPAPLDRDMQRAQARARELELELQWPECHPRPVPRAMRVAALACDHGHGAEFMLGMSRLAWGAGRDPEDPGEYEFLAAEYGLDTREAREAALEGSAYDRRLADGAGRLGRLGIAAAPALRWQGRLYLGSEAIAPLLPEPQGAQPRSD